MSMTTTHTPGPWHIGLRQAEKIIYDKTGWAVANATVYHGKEDAEQVKANARLIAAAPDMLAALQEVVDAYQRHFAVMPIVWQTIDDIASAAIAKAKGE